MRWILIVNRDNVPEIIKVFDDYFEGADQTDKLITEFFSVTENFPNYRNNEYYHKDGLTIGLYKEDIRYAIA